MTRPLHYWTSREHALLREIYPSGGVRACLPHFPVSKTAIYGQVQILGLRRTNRKAVA